MADSQQQPSSSTNDNVGSGVGNSVVNDLMRVYENLTQSSTPQAGVPDASKALSLAYNTNSSRPPPQSAVLPVYQPPPGYPVPPPHVYQQQQQQQHQQDAMAKNPLHIKSEPGVPTIPPPYHNSGGPPGPTMTGHPQQPQPAPGNPGHGVVPVSVPTAIKDGTTQRSGEESHIIQRTASMASKTSQASLQNMHQPAADASSESEKSGSGGRSSRRKRKQFQDDAGGPVNAVAGKKSGRGKKSKKEDGRWSKRFTWPEDLHRDFVSAIFDVGLKHSSPSTIMEHMPKHEQITTERIKSHLQKYRLHRVKSKKEFISSYEASLRNLQQNQSTGPLVSGSAEVAAHLTASTIGNNKATAGNGSKEGIASNGLAAVSGANSNQEQQHLYQSQNTGEDNDSLMLPQLTEAEKSSPIGAAMGYLMGLFFSLKQQLIIQRSLEAAGEKAKGNALFTSSTTSMAPSGSSNIAANTQATAAAVAAGVEFAADGNMQQSQQQNGVSVRSNIEVNSMMKREMQNQMALQNKMRALKQQELDKYKNINKGAAPGMAASHTVMTTTVSPDSTNPHIPVTAAMDNSGNVMGNFAAGVSTSEDQAQQQQQQQQEQPPTAVTQGAGEMEGTDLSAGAAPHGHAQGSNSSNLLGIENSEDFWNTDVVDDQLFEFLMNS